MPKTLLPSSPWLARDFPGLDAVLIACDHPDESIALLADAAAARGGNAGAAIRTAARLHLHRIPQRTSRRQGAANKAILRGAGRSHS